MARPANRPFRAAPPASRPASVPPGGHSSARPSAPPPSALTASQEQPRPNQFRSEPQGTGTAEPLIKPNRPGQTQQHLSAWMEKNRNLPLAEQQRALENEPGFRSLPPAEQAQLHQRLTQLNNMQPRQRELQIQRTEAMERLAPAQRQQVRAAAGQLGSLPEERQHAVARAFHAAVDMPPQQRQAWLNSPAVRGQFNDQERDTLHQLLSVQPFAAQAGLPGFVQHPAAAPPR